MKTYRIVSKASGHSLGLYQGRTKAEAVEAMDKAAGYGSSEEAAKALGTTVDALRASLVVTEVAS